MEAMIEVANLNKSYGSNHVLKDLSLTLKRGEIFAIVGQSGVGKSVLLRQIMGIEKPDSGSICILGQQLTAMNRTEVHAIRRRMGMVFQMGALFDSMDIEANTAFALVQHGHPQTGEKMPWSMIQDWVAEALAKVGLAGTQKKMPSDLSGGMRKRAALARAIIYKPEIIMYDEPTSGLDPVTAETIDTLITQMQEELQGVSIMVTHDIPSALRTANRIGLHENGRIAHICEAADFATSSYPTVQKFVQNVDISAYTRTRKAR